LHAILTKGAGPALGNVVAPISASRSDWLFRRSDVNEKNNNVSNYII
jgi:hypothetical protein